MARTPKSEQKKAGGTVIPTRLNFNPAGEGDPWPVRVLSGGPNEMGFSAEFSGLPAPARRFTADAYRVLVRADVVHLLFGQCSVTDPSSLRALVDVHMSLDSARATAATFTLISITLEQAQSWSLPEYELTTEPTQTATLTATTARANSSNLGACIDLYYASAFSFQALHSQGKIFLQPELRVVLGQGHYLGFSAALRAAVGLPPYELAPHAAVGGE